MLSFVRDTSLSPLPDAHLAGATPSPEFLAGPKHCRTLLHRFLLLRTWPEFAVVVALLRAVSGSHVATPSRARDILMNLTRTRFQRVNIQKIVAFSLLILKGLLSGVCGNGKYGWE